MTDEEMSIGEIARSTERIEAAMLAHARETNAALRDLNAKMDGYVVSVAVLEQQAKNTREDVKRIDGEVRAVSTKAAQISAIGAFLAVVASLIPMPWKR